MPIDEATVPLASSFRQVKIFVTLLLVRETRLACDIEIRYLKPRVVPKGEILTVTVSLGVLTFDMARR